MTVAQAITFVRSGFSVWWFAICFDIITATFDLQGLNDLFGTGTNAEIKLLEVGVVPADEVTACQLCLSVGTPTIHFRRLYTQDRQPVSSHRAYLIFDPTHPIVEAEMDVNSLQNFITGIDNRLLKRGQIFLETVLMCNAV